MESRAPKRIRLRRSRPSASVPSGCSSVGEASRCAEISSGSRSGKSPTVTAMPAKARTITRPASAAGSRTIALASSDSPKLRRGAGALGEADSGIQVAI